MKTVQINGKAKRCVEGAEAVCGDVRSCKGRWSARTMPALHSSGMAAAQG